MKKMCLWRITPQAAKTMMNTNTSSAPAPAPKVRATISPARLKFYLLALLVVAVVSTFSVVRQGDFVNWDDDYNLLNNPHLTQGLSWTSLRWMFTDASYVPRYMPLGWLGFALNCPTGHMNPTVFLLGNLFLHATNTVLIFLLLARVFTLWQARLKTVFPPAHVLCGAALGAAFWALHPLRVETVAWASARLYQQTLLFLLLSTLAYLRAHEAASSPRQRRTWLWTSTGLFLASLLTYPLGLGFVFVLLFIDWYLLQRFSLGEARAAWLEKIPHAAAIAAVVVLTVAARLHSVDWIKTATLAEFTPVERVMQSFYVWANYLLKTVWPSELTPMPAALISFNPWSGAFLLSAAAVLGVSVLLFLRRRVWPGVAGLWLCYLICLGPLLGLTEHPHFACDRYSFVISVFFSVLLGAAALKFLPRFSHPAIPAFACVGLLLGLAMLSHRQSLVWRANHRLLPHIIAHLGQHPARAKVQWLYGTTRVLQRDWAGAEMAFRQAAQANPNYAEPHAHLGDALLDQGRPGEAIREFRRAVELDPAHATARQGLGIALGMEKRFDEAVDEFRELLRRDEHNANAWRNLGLTVQQLGQTNLSHEYFARAGQIHRHEAGPGHE